MKTMSNRKPLDNTKIFAKLDAMSERERFDFGLYLVRQDAEGNETALYETNGECALAFTYGLQNLDPYTHLFEGFDNVEDSDFIFYARRNKTR